jgi:hypothetical protein
MPHVRTALVVHYEGKLEGVWVRETTHDCVKVAAEIARHRGAKFDPADLEKTMLYNGYYEVRDADTNLLAFETTEAHE